MLPHQILSTEDAIKQFVARHWIERSPWVAQSRGNGRNVGDPLISKSVGPSSDHVIKRAADLKSASDASYAVSSKWENRPIPVETGRNSHLTLRGVIARSHSGRQIMRIISISRVISIEDQQLANRNVAARGQSWLAIRNSHLRSLKPCGFESRRGQSFST
jgi:hypothetical protein